MELEVIIGLEIHAQLNTKTKLFCSCDNDAFDAKPNTRVCPVCMGFPGMLPVLNQTALAKGVRGGAALGGAIQKFSKFDRKNYFYPDLPTGYQISQFDQPICVGGEVETELDGETLRFGITRVHLENDAGKLSHNSGGTMCDYNRAGTPLVEIVTEPDLRSAAQARALAQEIQKILRSVDASNADMEKGMMRFDASISLRPKGEDKLYPRTEIKNLNSFTALYKALSYEIKRQKTAWSTEGAPIKETTVGWVDDEEVTKLLRDKESAHDYRYFPEPDLPPVTFTDREIKLIVDTLPELPLARKNRYQAQLGLTGAESLKLAEDPELFEFFEKAIAGKKQPKKTANLFLSVILADTKWRQSNVTPEHLSTVVEWQQAGRISSSAAKEVIQIAMESGETVEQIVQDKGLEQKSDSGEIGAWVDQVMSENESVVEDIKNGKDKGIQFLVGQVMKLSRGSANPPMVMSMLKEKIG